MPKVQTLERLPTDSTLPLSVAIAICTRNRAESLQRAIDAVIAANPSVTELLIIDQSDDVPALTWEWDRPIRHVPVPTRGLSYARNTALALATSELVFFTDDDCILQRGSVERAAAMFAQDPTIGLVFGAVANDHSVRPEGFIPTYYPPKRQVLRGRLAKLQDGGVGAFMVVRRETALQIGGFDQRLGAGAPLSSCEDGEFAYRTLKCGYAIGHVPDAKVLHEGIKPWSDSRFVYATFRAVGAAYALHLRQRDLVALLLLIQQVWFVLEDMVNKLLSRRKPTGVTRLRGLLSGIGAGLTMKAR